MHNDNDKQNVLDAIRQAVAEGDDIQNKVRDIVVDALTEKEMQPDMIRQVLKEAVEGASEAAKEKGGMQYENLQQAIKGIDIALSHAAEASKLAIEEAVGNIQRFSEEDLHRAVDDIGALETMFLDTLGDVAKSGTETVGDILNDLMDHGKNTGTAVGSILAESLQNLQNLLTADRKEQLSRSLETAQAVSESIAGIASGLLAGIAENLKTKNKS